MPNVNPNNHLLYGALIVVVSTLGWFESFVGFFIGLILALIGESSPSHGILLQQHRQSSKPPRSDSLNHQLTWALVIVNERE